MSAADWTPAAVIVAAIGGQTFWIAHALGEVGRRIDGVDRGIDGVDAHLGREALRPRRTSGAHRRTRGHPGRRARAP
jgi:hypothetical protein